MIYIFVSLLMMVFTIFCFRRYIHPGTHKGFSDQQNNYSWVPFGENWWDKTDDPVNVSSLLASITRLWFWLVTGLNIKEWAAVHRHNSCHEEKVFPNGKTKILSRARLFLKQRKNKELVQSYSSETPETKLDLFYQKFPLLGPVIFLILLFILFKEVGLIMWAAQMAWIPFWCSESANGWKFKTFEQNRFANTIINNRYYE